MSMQHVLGFEWDATVLPTNLVSAGDQKRALFRVKKLLSEFVWDTTFLEDNPFTFPEVKTLLEGVTVGGHKLSDEQQVLNQAKSWERLIELVKQDAFAINKRVFCELNSLVACEESLVWGVFRTSTVSIAGTAHTPPSPEQLETIFNTGCEAILDLKNPLERGLVFFLFGSLHQFFYDGNKRTSRLMMNGELLRYGFDAITIPAARKQEFNEKMIRFYDSKNGTEMFTFLLSCYP